MQEQHKHTWEEYYARVVSQPHRPLLEDAVAQVMEKPQRTAIDCGCGAGRDSAYLLAQGFVVHAFDAEASALEVCRKRFADAESYWATQASFETFDYPSADLIVANASLFFCDPTHFETAWRKLTAAMPAGGIFCGDILGLNDGWVHHGKRVVSAFAESEVRALFDDFDIIEWRERDEIGRTAIGSEKQWHYYTVLATKKL